MNDAEKDLTKAEKELQDTLLTMILYLNCNGVHIDRVKEMIYTKVDTSFEIYEEENIRDKWERFHLK